MLADLSEVDLSHVDHEFFGIVYQKFINNGNASHYTNSKLSREMANYIASRSSKSQMPNARAIYLEENDYILDPALGSGQLLRGLLPFHRVFFQGNSSGVDGWRRLARHFMGRDIDATAIWIAKINIWLATADKGEALVNLDEFKPLDVISATVDRRAGESIRQAFQIQNTKNVAGCVSNPPWDAFINDSRRGRTFDPELVEKIKRSLTLEVRQLNRAQIFLKIIQSLGNECRNMRFAIILPDSIFVDQNDPIRRDIRANVDFYFSYPRNIDPANGRRIFGDVDNTRKFGIVFGRSTTDFPNVVCYPFGADTPIVVGEDLSVIGDFSVFPLFSHAVQERVIRAWKNHVVRRPQWSKGEFDPSLWSRNTERVLGENGTNSVIGGDSFCKKDEAWSAPRATARKFWNRFESVSAADREKRNRDRVVFSDYINNSLKKNSSSFLPGSSRCNVIDAVLYSFDCLERDSLIYDSVVFSTFVECYATSQHMSAWRLQAVGLPRELTATEPLPANVELIETLGLTLEDALELYEINKGWLATSISLDVWRQAIANLPAGRQERQDLQRRVGRNRRVARPARQRNQR